MTGIAPAEPGSDTFELAERFPEALAATVAENGGEEFGLSKKFEMSNEYIPDALVVF